MKARPITPESRIAVLGAGCAGLTCAEFLRLRGAKQVTVFEASDRAGGKVWSVPYEGAPAGGRGLFEAGTVFFVPGPVWSHVLSRYGVSKEIAPMPSVRIADLSRGRIRHPLAVSGGWSVMQRLIQTGRFLRMLERYGPVMDQKPGLQAHARPDLAMAAGEWFTQAGMPFVRQVLLPIAGGAQFGPQLDQVPALYVIRLLTLLRRYPLVNQLRLAMPQLRAGHEPYGAGLPRRTTSDFGRPCNDSAGSQTGRWKSRRRTADIGSTRSSAPFPQAESRRSRTLPRPRRSRGRGCER